MNGEAIIQALLANIGDPHELILRSNAIDVPQRISKRASKLFKKKYGLLGQAMAQRKILKFAERLKEQMDSDKEQKQQKSMSESQYKSPTGYHLRNQTSFRQSFGPSKSFGGVEDTGGKNKKGKKRKIDELEEKLMSVLEEGIVIRNNDSLLSVDKGELMIDGQVVATSHVDILKLIVMWLLNNREGMMGTILDGVSDMVRNGDVIFR